MLSGASGVADVRGGQDAQDRAFHLNMMTQLALGQQDVVEEEG